MKTTPNPDLSYVPSWQRNKFKRLPNTSALEPEQWAESALQICHELHFTHMHTDIVSTLKGAGEGGQIVLLLGMLNLFSVTSLGET